MDFRDRWLAALGAQLAHPRGLAGRIVGRVLNRANGAAITEAVNALDVPPAAELADLGFGGGSGLRRLLLRLGQGGRVHGIDLSATMLAAAAHRFRREIGTGQLMLHQASMEHLPLTTASVDGVITLNTLYFITDLSAALGECARVLRPSGQLVIGLGDPDTMARQAVTAHGFHVRSVAEVTIALLDVGLVVDQHRRVGTGDGAFHLLVVQPL